MDNVMTVIYLWVLMAYGLKYVFLSELSLSV